MSEPIAEPVVQVEPTAQAEPNEPVEAVEAVAPVAAQPWQRLAPVPETGDARVDDALSRLAEVPELPVAEHQDVYQDIHRRLHDALADLDAS